MLINKLSPRLWSNNHSPRVPSPFHSRSKSLKIITILMKRCMQVGESVGGCRGRLLIDISDHCSVVMSSGLSQFSLLFLHGDPSPLKVCNTPTRRRKHVASWVLSSVICFCFPLEALLTLLQVGFQLAFVAFPLSPSVILARRKLSVSLCSSMLVASVCLP